MCDQGGPLFGCRYPLWWSPFSLAIAFVQFAKWGEELKAAFDDEDATHVEEHLRNLSDQSAELRQLMKADVDATE